MEARLGCQAQMWPCALPGSGGVSVVDWPDGWCFRGLGAGEGLGGLQCLISGAQMDVQVRVPSEKHKAIFLKGGLRQEMGGVPGGA